ncbi:type 1 fimbrial protein [Jejubacter calystegiae]|uniref:Type 1 fimbrial protein n=1 Tax=Jejubacter calystegiae TaxID=2579935 RepID=A0A4P8YMI9_9ENTR|nr:fimbrial protein [Jejubacter calystegiae]QCT19762.1 type 1 fimbrial protein [Jejubacter calystegiae]
MNRFIRKWLLALWMALLSVGVSAVEKKSDVELMPNSISYFGPSSSVGSLIGGAWSTSVTVDPVFNCGILPSYDCYQATIVPDPSLISAGISVEIDGVSYTVYETGTPGLGFVMSMKDAKASNWIPLSADTVNTYPAAGTNSPATSVGLMVRISYVTTGKNLQVGSFDVPAIRAAVFNAYAYSGGVAESADITIAATSFSAMAYGCAVDTKDVSVELGSVDVRTLDAVGAMSERKSFSVTLSCAMNIALYASISDMSHPGNFSDAVSLTPDSSAQGVGVAFFYNGQGPLWLGQDSADAGIMNQFFIQDSGLSETLTLPFQVSYYRKGDIVPGSANALAGITFSYQ